MNFKPVKPVPQPNPATRYATVAAALHAYHIVEVAKYKRGPDNKLIWTKWSK